jgi:adenylate cyclase
MAATRTNRRLAAILAADVVGYSRMMAIDETGTMAALKRHREAVFDPAVAEHGGRIVKLMGDGALVEFGSVVDAVKCALAVQRSGSSPQPEVEPTIVLRIGINLGDIIIDGEDIYGDGVNIAARLEPSPEADVPSADDRQGDHQRPEKSAAVACGTHGEGDNDGKE